MIHAIQTITKRGFTERQARFLVLVARHSGVCVIPSIRASRASSLARRRGGFSTSSCSSDSPRPRTARTIADASTTCSIGRSTRRSGEPDSRLRRPPSVPRTLERLMLLDAILENPESIWDLFG